mgnify:CR=1 FL=1
MKALEAEVNQLIMRNQAAQAMKLAVGKLPSTSKSAEVKQVGVAAITAIFAQLDKGAIDNVLGELSEDERATVMKYVFKCMEGGDKKVCESLLIWHAKLVEKDGHGIIMRAFIDKHV